MICMSALIVWVLGSLVIVFVEDRALITRQGILLSCGCYALFLLALSLLVYRIFCSRAVRKITMLDRMRRLFSMFDHIETLVLHNAWEQARILCASLTALGSVTINRLEVRSGYTNYFFRFVWFHNVIVSI